MLLYYFEKIKNYLKLNIVEFMKKFYYYEKYGGIKSAINFLLLGFSKNSTKYIELSHNSLYVRPATTDLLVAIDTFVHEELGNIRCTNPSTIIDAGAYIDTSAIYFAKKYPSARVYAIEPEDGNYDIMLKNIAPYNNIIPIKAALWDVETNCSILARGTGEWGYAMVGSNSGQFRNKSKIRCISMFSILQKYNIDFIDILKIDIEGSEKRVLENSIDWIDKVNVIVIELHDRIIPGCEKAFYEATKGFEMFEKNGEKIIAYKKI